MTEAEFLSLPPQKQDALVAEKVMEHDPAMYMQGVVDIPSYTTDIAAAFDVVAVMMRKGFDDVNIDYCDEWDVGFTDYLDNAGSAVSFLLPLAICMAALRTVGALK